MWADAILRRIGYGAETTATFDTLVGLQRAFMLSVPFENLDIHLGRRIVLEREQVLRKVVQQRRGGWCFELNEVFLVLLQELGFPVTRCASTVLLNGGDAGEPHAFDHLALLTKLAGRRWLLDVGFGDSSLRALDLDEQGTQTDDRANYRVVLDCGRYRVECENSLGAWESYHRVDPRPREWHEFDERCQFLQTSIKSKFTRKRLCSRLVGGEVLTLSGNTLSHGSVHENVPENCYFDVLRDRFDVDLCDAVWIYPT